MKTNKSILAEIQRLMDDLVANHSARFVTTIITYKGGEQIELNAAAKKEVAACQPGQNAAAEKSAAA